MFHFKEKRKTHKLLYSVVKHSCHRPVSGESHSPKIKNIARHFNKSNIRTRSESLLFLHLLIQFLQNQVHVSVLVQLEVKILSDGMQREPLWSQLHQQTDVFLHFP